MNLMSKFWNITQIIQCLNVSQCFAMFQNASKCFTIFHNFFNVSMLKLDIFGQKYGQAFIFRTNITFLLQDRKHKIRLKVCLYRTIFLPFENANNIWKCGQFLNCWQYLKLLTIFEIVDNIWNCWQYLKTLQHRNLEIKFSVTLTSHTQ